MPARMSMGIKAATREDAGIRDEDVQGCTTGSRGRPTLGSAILRNLLCADADRRRDKAGGNKV